VRAAEPALFSFVRETSCGGGVGRGCFRYTIDMRLLDRIRTRALWVFVGVVTTMIGVIVWTTLPAWPIVGVAVATLVIAVNSLTSRLQGDSCLGCGQSLANQPQSENGTFCPGCGLVNQARPMSLAKMDAMRTLDVMQASSKPTGDDTKA
jgi:hypothetical protein